MSKPLLMKNIAINPEDYTILAVDDIATNIMLLKAVLSRANTRSSRHREVTRHSKRPRRSSPT